MQRGPRSGILRFRMPRVVEDLYGQCHKLLCASSSVHAQWIEGRVDHFFSQCGTSVVHCFQYNLPRFGATRDKLGSMVAKFTPSYFGSHCASCASSTVFRACGLYSVERATYLR